MNDLPTELSLPPLADRAKLLRGIAWGLALNESTDEILRLALGIDDEAADNRRVLAFAGLRVLAYSLRGSMSEADQTEIDAACYREGAIECPICHECAAVPVVREPLTFICDGCGAKSALVVTDLSSSG